jgi:hypothetical protein
MLLQAVVILVVSSGLLFGLPTIGIFLIWNRIESRIRPSYLILTGILSWAALIILINLSGGLGD